RESMGLLREALFFDVGKAFHHKDISSCSLCLCGEKLLIPSLSQSISSNFLGMTPKTRVGSAVMVLLIAACNSTAPPAPATKPGAINMKEPRRMVGTENNVRVDAEIYGEEMIQGSSISIKYEITNQRATPILIADLIAQSNYDPDTRTVTIDVGAEIPGEELLPRLI